MKTEVKYVIKSGLKMKDLKNIWRELGFPKKPSGKYWCEDEERYVKLEEVSGFMKEKDIKQIVKQQLKSKHPNWR